MRDPFAKERIQAVTFRVASNLRKVRVQAGMTQPALADLLGISDTQVYNYERGISPVSAGCLGRYAEIFRIPVEVFFKEEGPPLPRSLSEIEKIERTVDRRIGTVIGIIDRVLQEPPSEAKVVPFLRLIQR